MTHEFKTPIATITTFDAIKTKIIDDKEKVSNTCR
jgi:hypothetical protein